MVYNLNNDKVIMTKTMRNLVPLAVFAAVLFNGCTKTPVRGPASVPQGLVPMPAVKSVLSEKGYNRYAKYQADLAAHPEDRKRLSREYFEDLGKMYPRKTAAAGATPKAPGSGLPSH